MNRGRRSRVQSKPGDNDGKGWIMLPVQLKKGKNEFWLKVGRGGRKKLSLSASPKPIFLTGVDMTVPDFLTHEINDKLAAIRIMNATGNTLDGLTLRSNVAGTGFPDLMIVSPDMYTRGVDGVKAAGYFGNDWTVKNGSLVWSDD